jgi:K+-sensing histidine kinase KdpD
VFRRSCFIFDYPGANLREIGLSFAHTPRVARNRMSSRITTIARGCAITLAATAATFGLALVARDWLNISSTPMILAGLLVAAWYGGLWSGLVFCVLTDLTVDFALGEPRWEFTPDPIAHIARLIVLFTVSIIISSLRTARDRLEIRANEQAAVAEFGRSALAGTDLNSLLSEAVEKVVDVLDVRSSAICRVDRERDEMIFAASKGWSRDLTGQRFSIRDQASLAGMVAESAAPIIVTDIRNDHSLRAADFINEIGVRSMAGIRILSRDGVTACSERSTRFRGNFRTTISISSSQWRT